MKIKIIPLFFCFICFYFIQDVYSKINDKIIAKIGNEVLTNFDVVNEINTILALSNEKVNLENFRRLQGPAFISLKKKIIKEIEIEKYKVEDYNSNDLKNYINGLKANLGLKDRSLKDHFKNYNANYELFIKGVIINLKWNTLIYSLYRKQLNVDEEILKSEITEFIKEKNKIEEYNLSEIIIENSEQNETEKVISSIKEKGFEKTAILFSNSITSSKGGLIGWIAVNSISQSYLSEIDKLNKGSVSDPIINNNNIVFIKLNDKRVTNKNDLNLEKVKQNVINKKKEEMLNIFSNSHYLDVEKKTYIEINE